MTWYASQVYVEPTESIRSILSSHRVLSKGMYWIKDFDAYDWPPEAIHHALPTQGFFVVREVCDPTMGKNEYDTEVEAQWHINAGQRVLSWKSIVGPEELGIIKPPALPVYAFGKLHYDEQQTFPPPRFLTYLKYLAITTGTTVSYYHHKSGAGLALSQEFAWVFGPDESVIVGHGPQKVMKYTSAGEQTLSGHDTVLMLILRNYDIHLLDWFFAPHTRSFNWHKYDVSLG